MTGMLRAEGARSGCGAGHLFFCLQGSRPSCFEFICLVAQIFLYCGIEFSKLVPEATEMNTISVYPFTIHS